MQLRHDKMRKPFWDSAKPRSNRLHSQVKQRHRRRRAKTHQNRARHSPRIFLAGNHQRQRNHCKECCLPVQRREGARQCRHSVEKVAGDLIQPQPEKILELRARNENRNSVREADNHRARKIFHGRTHSRDSQQHQHHAGHHGARKQPVDTVLGDDSGHYNHERAGRSADLRLRTAERRDHKPGNNCAIESGLWRNSRRNCKRHRQRQGNQADGDTRAQICRKFSSVVISKENYGLW